MSCGQRLLGDYAPALVRPDPGQPLPVNRLWVREIADYMAIQARIHGRRLAVEDAMEEMGLRADGPDVAPAVAPLLRARGLSIVEYRPSRRPSRHGGLVAVWGVG